MKPSSSLSYLFIISTLARTSALASVPIVGGAPVSTTDDIAHRVVALVSATNKGQALCTASLVAPDLAITAAHCVTDPEGKKIEALALVFSTHLLKSAPDSPTFMEREVDRALVPSDWDPAGNQSRDTGDVALVHFHGGLPEGYLVSELLPFNHPFKTGEPVVVAGFGINDAERNLGAGILRKVKLTVMNPHFSKTEIEFDQSHGGGACHGDSGGPAYVILNHHPYLFGITSRGAGACDVEVVYTLISAYQDWFKNAVEKIRSKDPL